MQIVFIALENFVRLDVDFDIQVARRPTIDTRFAVTGRPDAHAVFNAGRNRYLQGFVVPFHAGTVARAARLFDFLTRASARRAGLLDAEEPLLHAHDTLPAAAMAGDRAGPRLGAGPGARLTGFPGRNANFRIEPAGGLLERDVERVFQVVAPIHFGPAL